MLPEDRELLAGFREGRRDALDRTYRHYVLEVARFLKHGFTYMSSGTPTAFEGFREPMELDNVVQEVFFRAFEARTRLAYDGIRPYGGFLIGIARNVALKEIERRAVQRARTTPVDDLTEEVVPLPPSAESIDERRGRDLVVAFLSDTCTDQDRHLFRLRFDDGLSQEAAASAAGLTRIQVRRWENKLKARLLRFLKRAQYLEGGQ